MLKMRFPDQTWVIDVYIICTNIMLFLNDKPNHLLITNDNKLIITNAHQVIFTTLHQMESYTAKKLIQPHVNAIEYSQVSSQALLAGKQAIQIYWTDWECRIQLRCFIRLSSEPVYSFFWQDSWKILGQFKQYSPNGVKFIKAEIYTDQYPNCFLREEQFILTNKRLVVFNHRTNHLNNIEWLDRDSKIVQLKDKLVQMKAIVCSNGSTILSISNLCLFVVDKKVSACFYHEGKLFVSKDVILWISQSNSMIIYKIEKYQILKLGEMQTFQGQFMGCTFTKDKLAMLFYDFKQLQVNYITLIEEKERLKASSQQIEVKAVEEQQQIKLDRPQLNSQPLQYKIMKQRLVSNTIQIHLNSSSKKQKQPMQKSQQKQKYNQQLQLSSQIRPPQRIQVVQIALDQQAQGKQSGKISIQAFQSEIIQNINESIVNVHGNDQVNSGQECFQWHQQEGSASLQGKQEQEKTFSLLNAPNASYHNDIAETPAFNNVDRNWGSHYQEWNMLYENKKDVIKEIDSSSKSNTNGRRSSIYSVQKDNRKYTQILTQIYRKQPQKFDEALETTLQKVIQQNQARIFFADLIKIQNPTLTRDRLLRLYRRIQDSQQNRKLMARALSQFRLQQVPVSCLPIKKQIINIFEIIYPTVYVQDLLEPSLVLYQEFIESYFSKHFTEQIIEIQDETIKLLHPRNLLNILLYLNEHFQIKLQLIFQVYIGKLIRYRHINTLIRLMQSNVCQICCVSKQIFQKTAESIAKEMLVENDSSKIALVQELMPLINVKSRNLLNQIAALIGYLSQFKISLNINKLFDIPVYKNSQEILRQMLFNSNPVQQIAKLNLPFFFRVFSKIQNQVAPVNYQAWHINITQQIALLLIDKKQLKAGIQNLFPLVPILKRSYVVNILFKYFDGKLANRLVKSKQESSDRIRQIFKILLKDQPSQIQRDPIPASLDNKQWEIFYSLCEMKLQNKKWQLAYILFHDINLAQELIKYQILSSNQFQYLKSQISKKRRKQITFIEINTEKMCIPLLFDAVSLQSNNSSVQFNRSNSPKSQTQGFMRHSFKGYDSVKMVEEQLCRSFRKCSDEVDPTLILFKIEVQKQSILNMLKHTYENQSRSKFLSALNMFDRQKVQLHYIEIYKSLVQARLDFDIEKIIPFQYFLGQKELAWHKIKLELKSQLNEVNFWTIYLLVEIIYQKEQQVVYFLIEKIIFYEMDDEWSNQIHQILSKVSLEEYQLQELREAAQQRGLMRISKVLSENL